MAHFQEWELETSRTGVGAVSTVSIFRKRFGHSSVCTGTIGGFTLKEVLNQALAQQVTETSQSAWSPHSMERTDGASKARTGKVVNCLFPNPDAVFRLICFPWAGGGSVYFAKWGQEIHNSLEVHSIRLAGRESRSEEPFVNDIHQVADEIAHALLPVLQDKSFAFFGHSMGAYIAFMTALCLKEKYKLEPMHIFVSSANAPHSKSRFHLPETPKMSEEQIIHYIMEIGGTPENLTNNEELLQQYIPKLMADIYLASNFFFDSPPEAVLSCGLTCFVGSKDFAEDLEAWKDITSGSFDIHVLPGNHFYLMEPSNESFLKKCITRHLELSALTMY
ncbi:S-acyl fatty acid synthase thioesterase, medium chain [Choloepus didactylus]|uniref:S-acyl fatty acid synthase thioesterase, medium chain n=1 Tax=Choloepus didactylus TaxID=27675 RepID=UPI00189D90BD|nr:S-acyl fatty acid synthase thioesterase, medium chain [Choloepus didactylus]